MRLEAELAGIVALDVAWGREALRGRWSARRPTDGSPPPTCEAILAAGLRVLEPARAGQPLALELPAVSERPLSAYALTQLALPSISTTEPAVGGVRGGGRTGMTAPAHSRPTWWPGSNGCIAHFRAIAAETLQTATTQRWTPEALLRRSSPLTGRNAANLAA